jgi:uncharacterized protein (TIGR00369 family)
MDSDGDPEIEAALSSRLTAVPFYRWMGLRIERARRGEVDLAMELEDHHVNVQGLAHGGVIATLLDSAAGLAVRTALEPGRRHVTAHLDVQFLSAARIGRLLAKGRAVRIGSQIAFAEASAIDGAGRTIARATSTLVVTEERPPSVAIDTPSGPA